MADADWPAADAVATTAPPDQAQPERLVDDPPQAAAPPSPAPSSPAPPPPAPSPLGPGKTAASVAAPGAAASAGAPPDLFARLAAQASDFGFYQAMRLLEAQHRDLPRLGRSVRPAQDALRLAQEPSAIFAPSTLAGFEPAQTADVGAEARPARLLVHFFGLFGPDGPLPLYLTDYAKERSRNNRDPSFQRFADIFHHRAMSLFYRAWADVRPTVAFDRPEQDRFALYTGALIGLGMDSLRERDAMPDLTKLHFAGRFANQTRHPEGLGAILSDFFTMPVRVECFIGAWLTMPAKDRTALGADRTTGVLGENVLVGSRVWSRQHKFRIAFGPLDLPDYLRLLPGGLSFHRLIPIVRNYVGDTLMWDVNLRLKRDQVPATLLGRQGRLGWTTWLMPRPKAADAAELFLDASADSFARGEHAAITAAHAQAVDSPPQPSHPHPEAAA